MSAGKSIRILILLPVLLWCMGLVWFITQIPWQETADTRTTDAIVVLTGGSLRLEHGLALLTQGRAPKLFISGVENNITFASLLHGNKELRVYANQLQGKDIALGHKARSTTGNAEEIADWVRAEHVTSVRLVTGNYHMPRSAYELQQAVPSLIIIADPVFPHDGFRLIILTVSEYNKYMVSLVRHVISLL